MATVIKLHDAVALDSGWVHVSIRKRLTLFLRIYKKLIVNMNWRYNRC